VLNCYVCGKQFSQSTRDWRLKLCEKHYTELAGGKQRIINEPDWFFSALLVTKTLRYIEKQVKVLSGRKKNESK